MFKKTDDLVREGTSKPLILSFSHHRQLFARYDYISANRFAFGTDDVTNHGDEDEDDYFKTVRGRPNGGE